MLSWQCQRRPSGLTQVGLDTWEGNAGGIALAHVPAPAAESAKRARTERDDDQVATTLFAEDLVPFLRQRLLVIVDCAYPHRFTVRARKTASAAG